jgi:hypothetical protein
LILYDPLSYHLPYRIVWKKRDLGLFAQDSWKVSRNLTLDLGGRLDIGVPADPDPFQVGGQTVNLLDGPYNLHGIRGLDASQPLGFKAAFDPRQVQFGLRLDF